MTPDGKEIRRLARELNDAREELEADLVAEHMDAVHDGRLVVMPFSETLDLSWLLCCSVPGSCPDCRKGVFAKDPQGKLRVARTPAGSRRTGRRR